MNDQLRTRRYEIIERHAFWVIVYEEAGRSFTVRGGDGRVRFFKTYTEAKAARQDLRPRHEEESSS